MLSRAKPAVGGESPHTDKRKKKGRKIPKLEDLLSQRDFTGASTLLEVMSKEGLLLSLVDGGLNAGYYAIGTGGYIMGNPNKHSQMHIPDSKLTINLMKYKTFWTGEMARHLKVSAAFPEDLNSQYSRACSQPLVTKC